MQCPEQSRVGSNSLDHFDVIRTKVVQLHNLASWRDHRGYIEAQNNSSVWCSPREKPIRPGCNLSCFCGARADYSESRAVDDSLSVSLVHYGGIYRESRSVVDRHLPGWYGDFVTGV